MKLNIRLCGAALSVALLGLTGCTTVVESEPATMTTTETTETTQIRRPAPTMTTETQVIRTN